MFLKAQSKFFAGLFRNEPKDEIYLVNYEISHNTMDAVLKYLYYGHFEKPLARDLLAAADMVTFLVSFSSFILLKFVCSCSWT